ncbi:sensor histidine kinase [Candidatus Sumerlaeota bacterium]|nr:sensor histidine kinase [Candidatus Sumerlaeota bacterium]
MRRAHQIGAVLVLAGFPTMAHYLTDPHNGPAHDIYQRLYYLPIILAGLWFGARGGVVASTLIAAAYFPHAIHGWHAPYSMFYRIMEIVMFVVVGWLTGWLSDRLHAANDAERQARQDSETAYANLKTKADELFALEEQLRRADRLAALGQLTAGLAHEIRNPLASIKTSVEFLAAKARQQDHAEGEPDFPAIILEETARLDRILTEFLQFARAEQGRPFDEPQFSNLAIVARRVFDLTEPRRRSAGVRVSLDSARLDVAVGICETHLHQVLLNLLLNSIDAMPDGGEFRVEFSESSKEHLTIQVEDTGPGIPPDLAANVFNPFFSTKAQGTGLGLSIVERILDAYGGSIAVAASGSGASSRFLLKLPLAK